VMEFTSLLSFLPPPVRVDYMPLFFRLSFTSPLPRDLGAPRTLVGRRRPPELHRRLESRHCHPNPPPHWFHAASVSLTTPSPCPVDWPVDASSRSADCASTASTPPHRPHARVPGGDCARAPLLAWAGPAKFTTGSSQRAEASVQMEVHYYSSIFNFQKKVFRFKYPRKFI
jgi:hypothetical protein